jgi:hypothetical protein
VHQRGDRSRLMRVKGAPAGRTFSSASFSPGSGGSLTITTGGVARIDSSAFNPSGQVKITGTTDADAADWEAGFIQTVHVSSRVGRYFGSKTQTTFTDASSPNVRDALVAGGAPWYDPNNTNGPGKVAFTKNDETVSVSLWDQPGQPFPWDTPDGAGKLSETAGEDSFTTWMIARQKSAPNTIEYLNWVTWKVDYRAKFNYASTGAKTVKSTKGRTSVTGSGTGQGSNAPVLSGTTANNSSAQTWS